MVKVATVVRVERVTGVARVARVARLARVALVTRVMRVARPCTQLVCWKIELTNKDTAHGKNIALTLNK